MDIREQLKDSATNTNFGPIIETLLNREPAPLVPEAAWNKDLNEQIAQLKPQDGVDHTTWSTAVAGLYLWNDDIHKSHDICQDLPSSTGSYWHAIMHRREPDYPNSKYWFRKVDTHPVYSKVREEVLKLTVNDDTLLNAIQEEWDSYAFVDSCEQKADMEFLQAVQELEIVLLLTDCLESFK
ncbi:MAG: hypothetical protein HRT89_13550 [Lentisphaeria bacterium]|nr:hypothetical protein [Lentisphaeria bacterium]